MATSRRFIQVDVFSPIPTQGNGLAVVVDAEGLDDPQLQAFAAWTNLAETTFLLPPGGPGRRLSGPHLHPISGAVLRRAPDPG